MNTDLLDRYLQAVSFWLPKAQRTDIAAELSEELRSQVEERRAALGRTLTDPELEDILTRWGHPMLVARRYLPQQYLIGPLLFPVYRLVLKVILLAYLLPWLLVWIGFVFFVPGYTSAGVATTVRPLLMSGLFAFTLVTFVFAAIERSESRSKLWTTWTASKLRQAQPARDPDQIPRTSSVTELILGLLVTAWWIDLLRVPATHVLVPDLLRVTFWPVHRGFYWSLLILMLASVVTASVNLVRPRWTRRRAAAELAIDAAGLVVVSLLFTAGPVIEVFGADAATASVHEFTKWINVGWRISLAIIAIGLLAKGVQAARRTLGKKPVQHWGVTFMTGD